MAGKEEDRKNTIHAVGILESTEMPPVIASAQGFSIANRTSAAAGKQMVQGITRGTVNIRRGFVATVEGTAEGTVEGFTA